MIPLDEIHAGSILIVDDEAPNVALLEQTLRRAGYTAVSSTSNPRKVEELVRAHRYDVLLLDIKMPAMDGFAVMERLHALTPDARPSILVITGAPDHKQRALDAGAKDFVSKPFELLEVLTTVHNMMEARLLQRQIQEHREDNPALSTVIQRNIRQILRIRMKAVHERSLQDRLANALTSFSGSMVFFYLHVLWFAVWFLLNTGHLGLRPFDPYPYGFLTVVVSLEAIFLATFVLISQNTLSKESERLADLGLQTSLLTEHELTRVLQMLRGIQDRLGISTDDDASRADADLAMETKPEDVLAEIARIETRSRTTGAR